MGYTEGKWGFTDEPSVGIVIHSDQDGERIQLFTDEWVRSVHDKAHQEDIANAYLIAAAPAMCEALDAILNEPDFGIPGKLFVMANKALAQARRE